MSEPGNTGDTRSTGASPPGADVPNLSAKTTVDLSGSKEQLFAANTVELPGPTPHADPASADPAANVGFSLEPSAAATGRSAWPKVPGYDIVGELGRGGMGVVYKARQEGLHRWVALKVILGGTHAGSERLARFQAEAEAVARLQHPNIVQIHEVGEHDGLPYFSLEFVDGGTLDQKVHRRPQPPREAAYLVETLARAMHYAHEHGVVHRDLKPANVLLTQSGVPKITDFGLAKRLESDSGQTRSGAILGTPSYMAPEQARGEIHAVGPLVDVYALGAVLYELLTGRPPFQGANASETIVQVTCEEPMPPSRWQTALPRDLETICLKCLQKEPSRRYADAGALAEDLRRYLAGEPILARPISAFERGWRWCRRNPRLAVVSALAVALLIAWAVTSTFHYYRIRDEQAATQREFERAEQNAQLAEEETRREAAARQRADANAREAGEQRKLALETLYSLVTQVEEKLRDKEGMSQLRKEVLQTALDGLKKVSRSAETSAFADRSMGVALQRMGDVYAQLGQNQETARLYEQSVKIFDRLAVQEPDNDWLPWNCAVSFDKLGSLSESDTAAARSYFERSLHLREALVAKINPTTPPIPPARRHLALVVSYIKLANLMLQFGDPPAALDHAQRAVRESEGLEAAGLAPGLAKQFQGMALYLLGRTLAHRQAVDEARQYLQRALSLRRRLVRENVTSADAKRELGAALDALGDLEVEQGHASAALEYYRQAQEMYLALCQKEKGVMEDEWYLAGSHYRLGVARQLSGDLAGARQAFTESRKLRQAMNETESSPQSKSELMLACARLGEHFPAARLAADLRRVGDKHPGILFEVACGYALCVPTVTAGKGPLSSAEQALQFQYTDAAMQCLRRAIELGYKDREALRLSPDLAPLRDLPAYQALLAQLPKS